MSEDPETDKPQEQTVLPDIFAGGGVGLLLGTVLSLSLTPVIAGFVSALTSLLAVFLGLDGSSAGTRMLKVNALRIGSFGFATVLGLSLGLYMRTNQPLAEAPVHILARWQAAFPENPTLASQMTLFERAGIEPAKWVYTEGEEGTEATINVAVAQRTAGVLYSALSDYDACNRLDPESWGSPVKAIEQFKNPDAPDIVKALGTSLADLPSALPDAERAAAVAKAHEFICYMQDAGGE